MPNRSFEPYVCLPYLHLLHEQPVGMGPIRFYPATKYDEFVSGEVQGEIIGYLESSGAAPRGSCIFVDPEVPKGLLPEMLVDAVYLLYFAANYQDLYYSVKPPGFEPLTHYLPTPPDTIKDPKSREELKSLNLKDKHVIEVTFQENVMSEALGRILLCAYTECRDLDNNECRRIIRSIRYFIHCFHDKFRNLLGTGDPIDSKLFEPEDFLFLVTAFETLYDIDKTHSEPDFKQKLRPVIHLKFGTPMETIWKWIDGFYRIEEELIHEGTLPDPIFRENQNFEIPYLSFAVKLFIYSIYHKLYGMGLVPATRQAEFMPLVFEGIDRSETLGFLWPETEILKKISILLMQLTHGKVRQETLLDVSMLSLIYRNILKYHENRQNGGDIQFIPTPKNELQPIVEAIENYSDEEFEHEGKTVHVQDLFPDGFLDQIQRRVA